MPIDWQRLCREASLAYEGNEIKLTFADGRQQRVRVADDVDAGLIRLWSVAAKPSALPAEREAHWMAWQRNRWSDLVGFKRDGRGRLIGEAWVPVAGLDADEWAVYVSTVAQSCDRLEYLLTGRDED